MPFLRQSYKQPVKQWGPLSAVQSALFYNAEKMGIDTSSFDLAMPLWGPGNGYDYSGNYNIGTNNGSTFEQGGLSFDANLQPMALSKTIDLAPIDDYSIMLSFVLGTGYSTTSNMFLGRYDVDNYLAYANGDTIRVQDNASINYNLIYPLVTNKEYTLIYTQYGSSTTNPNDAEFFLNGKSIGLVPTTSKPSPRFRVNTIGNGYDDATRTHVGIIRQVTIIRQFLTRDQNLLLSDNPWQLWQPRTPVFYSLPGTVTPTTRSISIILQQLFNEDQI